MPDDEGSHTRHKERTEPDTTDPVMFEQYRSLMFSIAYRMLGSATEAEDIVQDAYLRYRAVPAVEIGSPRAFLSTIVTRLCLNHLQSRQGSRAAYVGPWLPEPVLVSTDEQLSPTGSAEIQESISIAFLTLLEQLNPLERAVFLLREVFDYEYSEIAGMLSKTEVACRQMFSRAKKHIIANRPRFKADPVAHREMLDRFISAVRTGEIDALTQLLAAEVTLWADGGGKARGAATKPLHGRDLVVRFLLASTRFVDGELGVYVAQVNGETSLILRSVEKLIVVLFLTVEQNLITEIRAVGNPDKLIWIGSNKSIR